MKIVLEHVDCDLCGSDKYRLRYRKPDNWLWLTQFEYPVVECINCGLVFVNPRPTEDSMRYFYPKGYHDDRDTEQETNRYSVQASFLPMLSLENVLDIGCARGDFLLFLKKKYPNIRIFGNDVFSDRVKSPDITFCASRLPDCDYKDSQFDIVTAWAVLEHVHTPSIYFKEVSRILRDSGRFIFLVTNADSLYSKIAYLEDIPRHIYHFTKDTLKRYAERFGFEIVRFVHSDAIFDGRGRGAFHFLFSKFAGVTWEQRYFDTINIVGELAGKLGSLIDRLAFARGWEARLGRSGIMVVEFTKSN